jgi:hypothetical protein
MSVELNHTIIPAKDKWVSAKFLADIRVPRAYPPPPPVSRGERRSNGVTGWRCAS